MNEADSITSLQRCDFLWKLKKSDLVLSAWERRFLTSFIQSAQPSSWFTAPRSGALDRMWRKYGNEPEIGIPFPGTESSPIKVADADMVGCEYYVREDGRVRRCNEPAAWVRQSGFRYCAAHAEQVLGDLKRRGKTMHLFKFERKATKGEKS